jgi:hypothetical protein
MANDKPPDEDAFAAEASCTTRARCGIDNETLTDAQKHRTVGRL